VRAARLLGSAGALDRALNDPLRPSRATEPWVTTLRATLGDDAFTDAWSRGRASAVHDAVAYALGHDDAMHA
jgi:hypothetical protein